MVLKALCSGRDEKGKKVSPVDLAVQEGRNKALLQGY